MPRRDADMAPSRRAGRKGLIVHSSELSVLIRALEQSSDGIMVTDADLAAPGPRILYVNRAYEALSGYPADELVGRSPRLLQGPLTDRAILDDLKESLAAGRSFHGETVNYRRDGTPYWVEWDIAPVRAHDGRIEYFVAIQRETTRRKEAEQALERTMAALEVSNARLRELGSILSHDLQDPLGTARGFLDLLRSLYGDRLDASGREYVDHAITSLDRMTDKIRRLAEQAASHPAEPEVVDVNQIMPAILQDLHAALTAAGGEVQVGALPVVRAYRVELEEVLQNLISNAVKYRDPCRRLRIVVRGVPAAEGRAAIAVQDNGRGIRPEDQERVFERHQRGTGHDGVDGRGVGLAYVRDALHRCGGDVTLSSVPGEGSTFTIILPKAQNPTAALAGTRAAL